MSLLFDQNLSRRLPALLASEFPGSEQVFLAGLATEDDRAIWAYAVARGLAVVSKDSDFPLLSATLGSPSEGGKSKGTFLLVDVDWAIWGKIKGDILKIKGDILIGRRRLGNMGESL